MHHISFQPQPHPLAPTNQQQHQPQGLPPPKKLRRISRACDFCHKRSIRCKPSEEEESRCQNCVDFGVPCTYKRPQKKRGIKSGGGTRSASENGASSRDGEKGARMLLELTHGVQGSRDFGVDEYSIPVKWKSIATANEIKITNLVDVYFEVVYPIFPFFHRPSLQRRVSSRDYLTDQSFFADIMAICALASARARDGALLPGQWQPGHFMDPHSEEFFTAAKDTMPEDLSTMRSLEWMRTCALMALYGIQVGKIDIMHQYLGMYHILVTMDNLHDERNWPRGIGIVEMELRRRLFWSMYTLEVYSSIVWGSVIRCREGQSHVSYASEIDDEYFSDLGYHSPNGLVPAQSLIDTSCWLHGLNFGTELYRILEHAMEDLRRQQPANDRISSSSLFNRDTPDPTAVLSKVMAMYEELPLRFKEAKLRSMNRSGGLEDKFSFQAANITATLQLVRMILFTAEEATVERKCATAQDLLASFNKIPVEFLRAISSPLLHHLAGIGAILGSAIEGPISEAAYHQVRDVLLQMADLLWDVESGMTRNIGAASRLRAQITSIDDYMASQRESHHSSLSLSSYSHIPVASMMKVDSNPNIDPSLQDTRLPATSSMHGFQTPATSFNYSNVGLVGITASMDGMNVMAEQNFQLPAELLSGWPWTMDISHGFASSGPAGAPGPQHF